METSQTEESAKKKKKKNKEEETLGFTIDTTGDTSQIKVLFLYIFSTTPFLHGYTSRKRVKNEI